MEFWIGLKLGFLVLAIGIQLYTNPPSIGRENEVVGFHDNWAELVVDGREERERADTNILNRDWHLRCMCEWGGST